MCVYVGMYVRTYVCTYVCMYLLQKINKQHLPTLQVLPEYPVPAQLHCTDPIVLIQIPLFRQGLAPLVHSFTSGDSRELSLTTETKLTKNLKMLIFQPT